MKDKISVLFVCTGNICRSPMAEGVFAERVREAGFSDWIRVDSAGTHDYNLGSMPDERARAAALRRGIDISGHRARQIRIADFQEFDHVVAMDRWNYELLRYACPAEERHRLHLLMEFAPKSRVKEIRDPYGGEDEGFETALDLIEQGAEGLLESIRKAQTA